MPSSPSTAYFFNTVAIPIVVALFMAIMRNDRMGISQSWYEIGGTVGGFCVLSFSCVGLAGLMQVSSDPFLDPFRSLRVPRPHAGALGHCARPQPARRRRR